MLNMTYIFLPTVFLIFTVFLSWRLKHEKDLLQQKNIELEKLNISLSTQKDYLLQEKNELNSNQDKKDKIMEMQFENLANKIFEEKSKIHINQSEKSISVLINPLKEKLNEFQKKVEDTYHSEMRERLSLKAEIAQIVLTNKKMGTETENLTRALRGDVKVQGTWGEFILERLLQSAGLRVGEEYTLQGKDLKLKSEQGLHQRPDVILNLPDDKHLIIDSKVSLVSYERAMNFEERESREKCLIDFVRSIREHVKGLSFKNYSALDNLRTPEFVLLFFPLEGAFAEVLRLDPDLFQDAWDKNIVIVGPTTLLATLKTVASLWKQEKQNKNSLLMAKECGLLYDKFCGLLGDLEKIGEHLKKADLSYDEAVNKLKTGKGNLIDRVEKIRLMGAKQSKHIPLKFKTDDSSDLNDNFLELNNRSEKI